MFRVHATPDAVHEQIAQSEAVLRLVSGDVLDQATYGTALVAMIIKEARLAGATRLQFDVEGAGGIHDAMATANGLTLQREVLKMWRELPTGLECQIDLRPFVVGRDEAAFLDVNNRAFTWHPEQGGWDIERLQLAEQEDWFDPSGFLLHEVDGRLAGFCWTKIHADERPPLGEIFVIAVDPDFHGRGLGRLLVLAGLDSLAERELRNGILYVEGSNEIALSLYRHIGFVVTEAHRWWTIDF